MRSTAMDSSVCCSTRFWARSIRMTTAITLPAQVALLRGDVDAVVPHFELDRSLRIDTHLDLLRFRVGRDLIPGWLERPAEVSVNGKAADVEGGRRHVCSRAPALAQARPGSS